MVGGGGDGPPINGGEFLLQLLKNPPQHQHQHQNEHEHKHETVASEAVCDDPAVAAVGHSIPFSSSSHNLPRPFPFPPHNYFNQQQPLGLGFPQNPNPTQTHHNYFSNLGLIHTNHHQQQQQQQLVFGSDLLTSKNANLLKERELGMGRNALTFGNYVSPSQQQVRPPPGFSMSLEQSMDKGKSNHIEQLHLGGKRTIATDDQDSCSSSRDLEEHIHTLLLEDDDVDDEKNNKGPKSRDKDYRSDKRGQWLLNQRMRNHRSHTQCRGDINRLNAHFLEIYESLIPSEEEKEKQKQLMALLNKHVTDEWPGAQLFLYGSCANSFGFRKSDIDVCLAIGDADVDKSKVLLKLADILKSDNLENVQALTRARVPIVKLRDPVTGISCDICVDNVLAVINTKLLRDYSKIDVRLRQLAFIVKHWAKSRGVNETYQGTLSSYAYVLMCIHFLQQRTPSILPCLQGMEKTYKVYVDNVECSYFDKVDKLQGFGSRNGESIAQLVWAFFNYWAYRHDYANDVISIRMGCLISKREKDWTRRIGNDRHLICIEDPFEVSHDLGRVVDRRSIRVLREEFERAAEILQYDPNPCVKLFKPYVPS